MKLTKYSTVALSILFSINRVAYSHEEALNDLTDSSDDMELEPLRRNVNDKSEHGLPIDLSPSSLNVKVPRSKKFTTESATTTTVRAATISGPPLSRRYRRIYNPDESANVSQFPFMAALLMNGQLWCGGAIIVSDAILTAAHCLQLMLTVRVGSSNATSGGELYRVTDLFFHPNYKPNTLEFNFAVVKLHKNISMGHDLDADVIQYSRERVVPTDTQIAFLGWGSVLGSGDIGDQTLLQRVTLPVYDLTDCQEIYGRDIVTRGNFCAGYITLPKNVCNHDAGGPAILDGKLVGILSFSSKRCDQPDQPAVFSTVGVVADWLGNLGEKRMRLRTTDIKSPVGI
ncbi:unnamed protein product, partial [Iphiclides podalirius]